MDTNFYKIIIIILIIILVILLAIIIINFFKSKNYYKFIIGGEKIDNEINDEINDKIIIDKNYLIEYYKTFPIEFKEIVYNYIGKNKPITLKFSDIYDLLEYKKGVSSQNFRPIIHIGQRKLFINELQFLNNYCNLDDSNIFVIYAGGSPGQHVYDLCKFYLNIKLLVIDPSKHKSFISNKLSVTENSCNYERIYYYDEEDNDKIINVLSVDDLIENLENYNIFILNKYCDINVLGEIKEKILDYKFYFWSDIRTQGGEGGKFGWNKSIKRIEKKIKERKLDTKGNIIFDESETVSDLDILWNLCQQYNWINILQPEVSMLKFRFPYYINDIDYVKSKIDKDENIKKDFDNAINLNILESYINQKFLYPKGEIYLQPWQPKSSTETRLVIEKKNINIFDEYNVKEYDDKIYFYNNIDRVLVKHGTDPIHYKIGYCQCNDCAIEIDTLNNYIDKQKKIGNINWITDLGISNPNDEIIDNKILINLLGKRFECLFGSKLNANNHGWNI